MLNANDRQLLRSVQENLDSMSSEESRQTVLQILHQLYGGASHGQITIRPVSPPPASFRRVMVEGPVDPIAAPKVEKAKKAKVPPSTETPPKDLVPLSAAARLAKMHEVSMHEAVNAGRLVYWKDEGKKKVSKTAAIAYGKRGRGKS